MNALTVRNLVKTYKNGVQALKGIDLDVERGDFFAMLGPNGAGKTTLIGIVTSLINKTSGEVRVFGHSIDTELAAAKSCTSGSACPAIWEVMRPTLIMTPSTDIDVSSPYLVTPCNLDASSCKDLAPAVEYPPVDRSAAFICAAASSA